MAEFKKLNNKIDLVRDDIKNLEKEIKWETTKLQYSTVVHEVKLAVYFTQEIGLAVSKGDKEKEKRYKERLEELCGSQKCFVAVNVLFEGLTGTGEFHNNILQYYYVKSGGNRPQMAQLGGRLLQLLTGGVTSLMAYEASVRSIAGPKDLTPEIQGKLARTRLAMQGALDRCKKEFKTNAYNDLSSIMPSGDIKTVRTNLYNTLVNKYDWLYFATIVYRDVSGFSKHTIGGSRVERLHHHGKCAVAWYRSRSSKYIKNTANVAKMNLARSFIAKADALSMFLDAKKSYEFVVSQLRANKISYWGLAVVTRSAEYWYKVGWSGYIFHRGNRFRYILLLA